MASLAVVAPEQGTTANVMVELSEVRMNDMSTQNPNFAHQIQRVPKAGLQTTDFLRRFRAERRAEIRKLPISFPETYV